MLRPVGSSILRSASTHSSLYQRCYSVLWKNPLTNDYFQSLLFKGSESVKSIGRCTQCNRGFQQVSLQTQQKLEIFLTCSLNKFSLPLFSGLRLSQELPLGSCCNIRRCLELFCKNNVDYPQSKSHSISLANDLDHPKSKITFQQKVVGVFFSKRLQSSKIQNHISRETQRMQRNCSSSARTSGDSVFPKQ